MRHSYPASRMTDSRIDELSFISSISAYEAYQGVIRVQKSGSSFVDQIHMTGVGGGGELGGFVNCPVVMDYCVSQLPQKDLRRHRFIRHVISFPDTHHSSKPRSCVVVRRE